ncbi:MAG: type IV pilus secretin PilQ [Nevskia sp.]|nr:type IV pilus secretin PilQ [Nevskia sp.]
MFSQILEPSAPARAGRVLCARIAARGLALLALLACAALPAQAQQASRELKAVDFATLDGDRVQITLTLSSAAPQPSVFAIDKPARLSVDLPDTHLALLERYRKVSVGQVRSIAAVEAQGRTRLVVELAQPTAYNVSVDGNRILVDLAGTPASAASAVQPQLQGPSSVIGKIDFRRGEKGEGRVLVSLSDPRAVVDVHEEGGKIIARFKNTGLPDRLSKRLDVLDFATPVKYIDAQRDGVDTRVVVTPGAGGDYEQVAYQAGDQFVLELQPLSQEKLAERQREQPSFTGERISLSFQSVDIRSLLQIIADVAGTNMIVSDSVNGQIAMRLQNVPWDQALDIILRTKGLGMRRQGNVMLVAPVEEIAARERAEAEAEKQKIQLSPLHSEIIQINYAKASDLGNIIKNKTNSILSERGSVTIDDRTNSLLVLETRDKITEIRALVQRLDIPVRQVLIESRIVVANDNFERDLGTQFGVSFVGNVGQNFLTTGGTNVGGTDSTVTSYTTTTNGKITVPSPSGSNYNVNLPAPASQGTPGSIALSLLAKNTLVDLELSALQSEGKGEVVSSPRVITANAKPAVIKQGVEIPYQSSTSSGATSVSFKDAVLSLNVTPQITPDGRVIMDLAVHDDSVGTNVSTGTGGSTPSIDTREVDTQVLVDNGQTVVLGGIYQQTVSHTVSKIPMLGDIPVLGYLFRNNQVINNKTELLVFITPKILTEGLKVD